MSNEMSADTRWKIFQAFCAEYGLRDYTIAMNIAREEANSLMEEACAAFERKETLANITEEMMNVFKFPEETPVGWAGEEEELHAYVEWLGEQFGAIIYNDWINSMTIEQVMTIGNALLPYEGKIHICNSHEDIDARIIANDWNRSHPDQKQISIPPYDSRES